MSDLDASTEPLDDAPRRRIVTSRLSAPDWVFSAVIHLLLVMLLITSKAGPGGGSGGGGGQGGYGEGEHPGDAWIEAQMGSEGGWSPPAPLNLQAIEITKPLEVPREPLVESAEAVAVDPKSSVIEQTSYAKSDQTPSIDSAPLPDTVSKSTVGADGSSGGSGAGSGSGDGLGGDGSAGEGGDGQGGTSLFGIWDKGERFVYVIDRSSSMEHYGKLAAARRELESSLGRLEDSIEFHVLLYNQQVQPLNVRGSNGLVRATAINKNGVLKQLRLVLPDGGTQHGLALQAALKLRPTVVYFLTDAEDPGLTDRDIGTVARQLKGATRVHCIQFGEMPGQAPTAGNWLQKLAEATGGRYVHVRTDALRAAEGESRTAR
jgi:hypothetical protein